MITNLIRDVFVGLHGSHFLIDLIKTMKLFSFLLMFFLLPADRGKSINLPGIFSETERSSAAFL